MIKRFLRGDDYPLKVGKVYYNKDSTQYFKVIGHNPGLQIIPEYINSVVTVDRDLYRWKYQEGVIYDAPDNITIVEHK